MNLDGETKLIAIDTQANDDVMELDRFRKADRFPRAAYYGCATSNACVQFAARSVCQDMSVGSQMPGLSLKNSGSLRLCCKTMKWLSGDKTYFYYSL